MRTFFFLPDFFLVAMLYLRRTRSLLWGIGLGVLLLSTGCCGCVRDIMDSSVAASGLSRPSRGLTCENKNRVLDRIRWLELAQRWERQLKTHALSRLLEPVKSASMMQCNEDCSKGSPSCCDCFQVDSCSGFIDLACYTKAKQASSGLLSGQIRMEVDTMEQTDGQAFFEWTNICFPAAKAEDPSIRGVCVNGATFYSVSIDDALTPKRFDFVWTVRLWVQEGQNVPKLRLDGAVGYGLEERRNNTIPNTKRTAVYFGESSLLYQGFSLYQAADPTKSNPIHVLLSDGEVRVLGTTGEYRCCFKVDAKTGERRSSCHKQGTNQSLCTNQKNLCP